MSDNKGLTENERPPVDELRAAMAAGIMNVAGIGFVTEFTPVESAVEGRGHDVQITIFDPVTKNAERKVFVSGDHAGAGEWVVVKTGELIALRFHWERWRVDAKSGAGRAA